MPSLETGRLTQNFHLSEFIQPNDPLPSEMVLVNIRNLAQRLQVLHDLIGRPITINHAYTSPERKAPVCGDCKNTHHAGMGVDIPRVQIPSWMIALLWEKWSGGMGLYPGHIHLDIGPKRRW